MRPTGLRFLSHQVADVFYIRNRVFYAGSPWANQQFFMDEKGNVKGTLILGTNHKEPVYKIE